MTASGTGGLARHEALVRAVAAVPLAEELAERVRAAEPRLEFLVPHDLLPAERFPGDHQGDPGFTRSDADERRFRDLVDSADVLFGVPGDRADALAGVARRSTRLRWVQLMAAGGGAMVRAAALSDDVLQRVAFTTTAGVHVGPLAEFCELGLLAGFKDLPWLQREQRRHEWGGQRLFRRIEGSTVLVIGLGSIGREVARRLAAQGAHVLGTSRRDVPADGVERVIRPDAIADVAGELDGVVVTLPGTDATRGLVGAAFLDALKPGAVVVNVGRGTVIDQAALVAALQHGPVGYAALDVADPEPLPEDSPLWDLPNVLISPHTAARSSDEDRLIAALFADNATRFADGRGLRNRVSTTEFY